MSDKSPSPDERLQREFNRWADEGEGEKMERHHLDITEKTIRRMDLRPGERILDLGCGSGWATRLLARMVSEGPQGFGQVVGVDISDEMIRQARGASKDFENVMFVVGSSAQIPWEANFFDKVLSVDHFKPTPSSILRTIPLVVTVLMRTIMPTHFFLRSSLVEYLPSL